MKKYILIVICLFLFTGCEVTYNLDIDDYEEETIINAEYRSEYENKIYEIYSKKPIPLSKYAPIQSESEKKIKGIEYYKKNIQQDNKGMEIYGKFDSIPISESTILSYGIGDIEILKPDSEFKVIIRKEMKLFNQFPSLDKITVNIKSKRKCEESNADKVNGNTYTWIITRDNYKKKTIEMKFEKRKTKDSAITKFNIAVIILTLLTAIIVFIINIKNKKVNSL